MYISSYSPKNSTIFPTHRIFFVCGWEGYVGVYTGVIFKVVYIVIYPHIMLINVGECWINVCDVLLLSAPLEKVHFLNRKIGIILN